MNTVKHTLITIALIAALTACSKQTEVAETHSDSHGHPHSTEDSHHDHSDGSGQKQAGPNGGRIITSTPTPLEFFLTEDRHVKVTFVDADGKAAPLENHVVSLIGGDRLNPTTLTFKAEQGYLISTQALPDIPSMPIILEVAEGSGSDSTRERFNLNLSTCPTCEYKEYACICMHGEKNH